MIHAGTPCGLAGIHGLGKGGGGGGDYIEPLFYTTGDVSQMGNREAYETLFGMTQEELDGTPQEVLDMMYGKSNVYTKSTEFTKANPKKNTNLVLYGIVGATVLMFAIRR